MENDNKLKQITLSECEFEYIKECLNMLYDMLLKLPKNRRTPKFYLLENLLQNSFKCF